MLAGTLFLVGVIGAISAPPIGVLTLQLLHRVNPKKIESGCIEAWTERDSLFDYDHCVDRFPGICSPD